MNLEKADIGETIIKYLNCLESDYEDEVKHRFLDVAKIKYKEYSLINNDLLNDLFYHSAFYNLLKEDSEYTYNKTSYYWANHIIKEIDNALDFKALENYEIEQSMQNIKSQVDILKIAIGSAGYYKNNTLYMNRGRIRSYFEKNYMDYTGYIHFEKISDLGIESTLIEQSIKNKPLFLKHILGIFSENDYDVDISKTDDNKFYVRKEYDEYRYDNEEMVCNF